MTGATPNQKFLVGGNVGLKNVNNGIYVSMGSTGPWGSAYDFDAQRTTFLDLRGRKEVTFDFDVTNNPIDYRVFATKKEFNDPSELAIADFDITVVNEETGIAAGQSREHFIDLNIAQAVAAPEIPAISRSQMKLITAMIIQFKATQSPILAGDCRVK